MWSNDQYVNCLELTWSRRQPDKTRQKSKCRFNRPMNMASYWQSCILGRWLAVECSAANQKLWISNNVTNRYPLASTMNGWKCTWRFPKTEAFWILGLKKIIIMDSLALQVPWPAWKTSPIRSGWPARSWNGRITSYWSATEPTASPRRWAWPPSTLPPSLRPLPPPSGTRTRNTKQPSTPSSTTSEREPSGLTLMIFTFKNWRNWWCAGDFHSTPNQRTKQGH